MNTQLMQRARRVLLERQRDLLRRRNEFLVEEQHLLAQREAELEDLAADRIEADRLEHLSEADRAHLDRIAAALARIEAGTWGRCLACGAAIPEARLNAMPEADRCMACARTS